ncbi:hypothetical protein BDZ89DRAFT_1226071 [Hymenopellis radicata]|nr:hypothetical protein BDZ89DRAFT_1226071 [Hymenopellis radicata]
MNVNGRHSEDDAQSLSAASSSEQIPEYAEIKRKKSKIFGVRQRTRTAVYGAFDYEEKFPEDPIYGECSPTARVWRAYIEESQKFDVEVVEDWRDTIDVLLVFAGLFSAVVSTFAVEGYQNLQPDYQQLSTSLLIDLVTLQTNTTFEPSIPDLDAFSPTLQNIWVNGLWFTSLTMSLITALISGLIKQWLHHYTIIPSGTPRERSCIRQYRYRGLQLWHVPIIIGLLPCSCTSPSPCSS